jgi:hypothetical protein
MSKALPRIKVVEITVLDEAGQEQTQQIYVKKAGLGRWKQIINSIKKLFKLLPEFLESQGIDDSEEFIESLSYMDMIAMIPDIMDMAADEFINLLAMGTELEVDFLKEHVGIDEAVDLVEAIIEVNNLLGAIEKGKNLIPRTANPGISKATGTTKKQSKPRTKK